MLPPQAIVRMLETMDPLLSVRWGSWVGKWVIERKAVTPVHELKWLKRRLVREERRVQAGKQDLTDLRDINEEILSLQQGKRVLTFLAEKDLNLKFYNKLCENDITRNGGYSRWADEVEREGREAEARADTAYAELCGELAREAFGAGNGELSPYDFLMSKRNAGKLRDLRSGAASLKQLLGLRETDALVGRGGDLRRVSAPSTGII